MSNIETEWLSAAKLTAVLGVTSMTIWRWQQNAKLAFPKPTVINDRKYWHRGDINAWMRKMVVGKADPAA
jgi:predicted DNA-binding transcriptional regulator AlpA